MPRFTPNPAKTQAAGFVVLPKDAYVFKLGKPKVFLRTKTDHKEGESENSYGLRYPLTVVGGPQDGQTIYFSCFQHTVGGEGIAKVFQMAVYGYDPNNKTDPTVEAAFNELSTELNWEFDTDTGYFGDGWGGMEGKHVACEVDVKLYRDKENQVFNKWMVFAG